MARYQSWARYPAVSCEAVEMHWRHVPLPIESGSYLPYGNGRSYGDSCLNREGRLIDTRRLDRLIHLDNDSGVIRCEARVLLRDLLRHVGPIKFD